MCRYSQRQREEGERAREKEQERGSTFTSIRCSTNMQTEPAHFLPSPPSPLSANCAFCHMPLCMPVHVRVLVWSTCWKFKAPAHRQAMLITPQYAQKGGGAKGQQTKWCPNPELGGFSGRAWPAAIARRVSLPVPLLLCCCCPAGWPIAMAMTIIG